MVQMIYPPEYIKKNKNSIIDFAFSNSQDLVRIKIQDEGKNSDNKPNSLSNFNLFSINWN
jgi:hypothetical protein